MTRNLLDQSAGSGTTGAQFAANWAGHLSRLLNAAAFSVTGVGGTGNAVTGRIDAQFHNVDLVFGQTVRWIHPAANLTDNVTIELTPYNMDADPVVPETGGVARTYPVLNSTGSAITAGQIPAGALVTAVFDGGNLRVTSGMDGQSGQGTLSWIYTSTQTWTRPTGRGDDDLLLVVGWGGGGAGFGGATYATGGGGGMMALGLFRLGDIPASILATVAAGGATSGSSGGTSTFGALLSAPGGGGGTGSNAQGTYAGGVGGSFGDNDGAFGGSDGVSVNAQSVGLAINSLFGAAGGGARANTSARLGGLSMFGGDGGSGSPSSAGAGQAPGGGGGGGNVAGAGARGEWRAFLV